MPITTSTSVYDSDAGTDSYLHDITITPTLDGSKDAPRLRRGTKSNFPVNGGPCESIYHRRNNFGQISTVTSPSVVKVDLNPADREFLEAMGTTNGFTPPGVIGPKVIQYFGNVLLSVYGANPRVRTNGQYLVYGDLYRIFAPNGLPDCAIDVDLPAPWSTDCRLIYRNGSPFLTRRTPPSGWTRYMQRACPSEHFRASAGDACAQVYPLGDGMISQWWAFGPFLDGTEDYYTMMVPGSVPEIRHTGGIYPIPAFKIDETVPSSPVYSDIRIITLRGQWFSLDQNAGDYASRAATPLGSDFAVPYTDITGGIGGTAQIVPDLMTALPAPAITNADSPILVLTLTSHMIRTASGDYDIVQEIMRTGYKTTTRISTGGPGNLWCPNFTLPAYYPWDVKLNRFGPDEAGITWTTHNGYIPPSVPTVPLTDYAPTLLRDGQVVYLRGGHDLWDETASAAYTVYLAAIAAASTTYDAAIAAADATYAAAIAGPAATRDAAIAAAQAIYDASPQDYSDYVTYTNAVDAAWAAFAAATASDLATLNGAYAAATATRDAADAAASAVYNAADWYAGQVKTSTPAGGGFTAPTTLARANIGSQESSGLLRIWCPELGQEWTAPYTVGLAQEVIVDGTATGANPPYHAGYSFSGAKKPVTSFTTMGPRRYPGPAILLPNSTIGKALIAEVTCAQAMGQAGGLRRTIRRWNPAVP